jgi:hypothetical protein
MKTEKNILIADKPEEFAAIFKQIALDANYYSNVSKNGFELIKSKYSNDAVIQRLLYFYKGL